MPYVLSLTGSAGDSATLGMIAFEGERSGTDLILAGTTLEAWIKTSTPTAQALLSGSQDGGFDFFLTGDRLHFVWSLPDGSQQTFQSDRVPRTLADSCWHHVAVSFSAYAFDGNTSFFVDGKPLTQERFLSWKLLPPQQLQVRAGAPSSSGTTIGTFNGALTDLRIWNTVQSSGDILARYQANLSAQTPALVGYWPLSQGLLQNQVSGDSAGVLGGSASLDFDTDPAWFPLSEVVCNVPSQPFPVFTGEAATAYQSILQQLGTTDLRAQYPSLTQSLSSYQSNLLKLPCAPSVPAGVWSGVVQQLDRELTAVLTVGNYFTQVNAYLPALATNSASELSSVATLVAIEDQAPVSGSYLGLTSELVSLLSSVSGDTAPVMTAVSAALGALATLQSASSGSSDEAFQVEYSQLWDQLASGFDTLKKQAGDQQQAILTDWGRLRTAHHFMNTREDMSWPAVEAGDLATDTRPYCRLTYTQLLVRFAWRLYELDPGNFDGRGIDNPSQCGTLGDRVPNHAWRDLDGWLYVIAKDDDLDTFPSPALMDLLFKTEGIDPTVFFAGGFGGMGVATWHCCNDPNINNCQPGVNTQAGQQARLRRSSRTPEVQRFLKDLADTVRAPLVGAEPHPAPKPSTRPPAPSAASTARALPPAATRDSLGPPAGSRPATMLFVNGSGFQEQHIFYRGTDNTLAHVWRDGQGLHSDQWTSEGAPLAVGVPVALADSSGQHLFYRSTDGNVQHIWFDGAFHNESWTGGPGQAPGAASDPAAVLARGQIHVFYRGTDDAIYHCWKESSTVRWEPCMAGSQAAPPARGNPTAAAAPGTLDVFYREKFEGNLYHLWLEGTAWRWEQWAGRGLGSPASVGDPAVALVGEQSALQLFYRDTSGNINHVWMDWNGPQWEQWGDGVPPQAEGDPVTMVTSGNVLHVFYRGGLYNNAVIHIWWDGAFHQDQWTGSPGGPPAAGRPATQVTSDGEQHLFYRGTDECVYHVWFDGGMHSEPWTRGVVSAPKSESALTGQGARKALGQCLNQ